MLFNDVHLLPCFNPRCPSHLAVRAAGPALVLDFMECKVAARIRCRDCGSATDSFVSASKAAAVLGAAGDWNKPTRKGARTSR